MNLQELREMVGSIVDYDPDVQTYRDEVTRVINELYLDFFVDKPWKFAVKTTGVPVYKDVTVSGNIFTGVSNVNGAATFPTWSAGSVIEIKGTTADNGEYEVSKFVSTSQLYIKGFIGSNTEAATFVLKQRYVDMPKDCAEVVAVGLRNPTQTPTTSFDYLPRYRDEQYGLLLSAQGQPTDWLTYDDETVLSPVLAPTLIDGGAGGGFTGETHVKYTLIYQNRESAPSPDSVITLDPSKKLNVTNMQDTGGNSGYEKGFIYELLIQWLITTYPKQMLQKVQLPL